MANANWYQGTGAQHAAPVELPTSLLDRHADPAGYLADPGLVDAVNVALHLGQPLLLTGQPGTGKTQLANSLAWELGLHPLLKFEAKSTSVARDLFYTYDTLGRFHAAHTGEGTVDSLNYIHFNALGLAILRANEPASIAQLLTDNPQNTGKQRSVVLIDEIDKAPRDFPNDLLNEVEGMYFKIPELGNKKVTSDPQFRPILILTSNSEKNLPEAFLRRCVFYDIPFPDRDRLSHIVHSRLGEAITDKHALLQDALDLFDRLRDPAGGLHRKPSTSELLAWLRILTERSKDQKNYIRTEAMIEPALASLIKTSEDRPTARELLNDWLKTKQA